jgi:hypothetical protein
MNHDGDGFEAAPNMVPGDIEAAEQFDPANGPARKTGMKAKLFFVFAGLLFAGGWGYANKKDFKDALGLQEKSSCASQAVAGEEAMHGCCPDMMAAMAGEQAACQEGSCPLTAEADAVAKKETCCEDGRKKAMIAALLEGTGDRTDDATNSSEETAAPKPEDAAEEVATPEKKEASVKDAEKTESKKVEAETKPAKE